MFYFFFVHNSVLLNGENKYNNNKKYVFGGFIIFAGIKKLEYSVKSYTSNVLKTLTGIFIANIS